LRLFSGQTPEGKKLKPHDSEIIGYDFQCSAQKSVSIMAWVNQMRNLLPQEIHVLIRSAYRYLVDEEYEEEEAQICRKAFDLMCSPLRDQIRLRPSEKIPRVYYAEDYVYRPKFLELNAESPHPLDRDDLAQAMFLHRGLFLQAFAHESKSVYMPYHYRGKMLSKLPPMIWVKESQLSDGFRQPYLPLIRGERPNETDYQRRLNAYYYSLLESVSWKTYSEDVPFVGVAILSKAKGDPSEAFKLALDLRNDGKLRSIFSGLQDAIEENDRPRFESTFKNIQTELQAAAESCGVFFEKSHIASQSKVLYKLAVSWLPRNIQDLIEAAAQLLPRSVRDWGRRAGSHLLTKSRLQMLFMDHVSAVRSSTT
jgi:hypothetical protein